MEGLLGRLLGSPIQPQPVGEDKEQWMRVSALQTDGIPFGFTRERPADLTGRFPAWREFAINVGDIDSAPLGFPMGPRHFRLPPGS